MEQFTLGEVCTIIKGSTGIKKAIAGDYPLVVTAEERLSSNEYQFDTKAVCIPLVSSTGHGHASLKRIHYQEGKFALGNILAAVIPNDEKQLNAEFLYYYLSFYKDSKIVPLMKGAANVSLTINSIKTIIIEIPNINIQEQIVEKIKKAKYKNNLINKKCLEQELLIQSLKESLLLDAVRGILIPQKQSDKPASELLKRIKAEKEQLVKDGKLKNERPMPPITEDEFPYELPKGWEWTKLGSITTQIHYGYTASAENSGNVKLLRITDIQDDKVLWNNVPFCSISDDNIKKYMLQNRDILIARTGGTMGKTYVVDNLKETAVFASYLIRAIPLNNINEKYIKIFMESPLYWKQLKEYSMGTGQPNVNGQSLSKLMVPLPPLTEQLRIVNKINKLLDFIENLKKKNDSVKENSLSLLKSIEEMFLTVYLNKSSNIIDLKEKRAILSAKIISQLYEEQYFGAIKLEKIIYFCETHLKINLGGKYKQEAAGPHDAQARYEVEDILKNKKWFSIRKEQKNNIEVTKYTPLEKSNEISEIFNKVFSAEVTGINNLLELFRGKNSDFCESVATLYAVWLNRLSNNLSCTDTDLIADFKAWSKQKARFYDSDLQDRILFMRRKNLIPDSNIK
ncbi:restriction endonuclease subunit S [bacterium]|nr:restriction endonuclease subunit S [bacterium]